MCLIGMITARRTCQTWTDHQTHPQPGGPPLPGQPGASGGHGPGMLTWHPGAGGWCSCWPAWLMPRWGRRPAAGGPVAHHWEKAPPPPHWPSPAPRGNSYYNPIRCACAEQLPISPSAAEGEPRNRDSRDACTMLDRCRSHQPRNIPCTFRAPGERSHHITATKFWANIHTGHKLRDRCKFDHRGATWRWRSNPVSLLEVERLCKSSAPLRDAHCAPTMALWRQVTARPARSRLLAESRRMCCAPSAPASYWAPPGTTSCDRNETDLAKAPLRIVPFT